MAAADGGAAATLVVESGPHAGLTLRVPLAATTGTEVVRVRVVRKLRRSEATSGGTDADGASALLTLALPDDKEVSGRHAHIDFACTSGGGGSSVTVRDTGSTNGTFLRATDSDEAVRLAADVSTAWLPGARIAVGTSILYYTLPSATAAAVVTSRLPLPLPSPSTLSPQPPPTWSPSPLPLLAQPPSPPPPVSPPPVVAPPPQRLPTPPAAAEHREELSGSKRKREEATLAVETLVVDISSDDDDEVVAAAAAAATTPAPAPAPAPVPLATLRHPSPLPLPPPLPAQQQQAAKPRGRPRAAAGRTPTLPALFARPDAGHRCDACSVRTFLAAALGAAETLCTTPAGALPAATVETVASQLDALSSLLTAARTQLAAHRRHVAATGLVPPPTAAAPTITAAAAVAAGVDAVQNDGIVPAPPPTIGAAAKPKRQKVLAAKVAPLADAGEVTLEDRDGKPLTKVPSMRRKREAGLPTLLAVDGATSATSAAHGSGAVSPEHVDALFGAPDDGAAADTVTTVRAAASISSRMWSVATFVPQHNRGAQTAAVLAAGTHNDVYLDVPFTDTAYDVGVLPRAGRQHSPARRGVEVDNVAAVPAAAAAAGVVAPGAAVEESEGGADVDGIAALAAAADTEVPDGDDGLLLTPSLMTKQQRHCSQRRMQCLARSTMLPCLCPPSPPPSPP